MLTNNEKIIIKEFRQTRIPSAHKYDDTDNILYIEHVDFDLCDILLKNKKVSNEYVQNELKEFANFLTQLNQQEQVQNTTNEETVEVVKEVTNNETQNEVVEDLKNTCDDEENK